MKYLIVSVWCVALNFSYQAFNLHEYMTAFERSFFQIYALSAAWLISYFWETPSPVTPAYRADHEQ